MLIRPIAIIILLAPFLAACATVSREECLTGDWFQLGLQDGQQGRAPERLEEHQRACGRVGVVIESQTYFAGRTEGLVSYCTPQSGYQVAANREPYLNVCPVETEPRFLEGFVLGQIVGEARRVVELAERQVRQERDEIASLENELEELRDEIVNTNDADERRRLNTEARNVELEIELAEADLEDAQEAVLEARERLAAVQAETALQLQALL